MTDSDDDAAQPTRHWHGYGDEPLRTSTVAARMARSLKEAGMGVRHMLYGAAVCAGLMTGLQSVWAQTPTHTPPPGMTCPGDRVVWVNIPSRIYHFEGERYFGSTKNGKFMCQHAADQEGDRPTRNGQ